MQRCLGSSITSISKSPSQLASEEILSLRLDQK